MIRKDDWKAAADEMFAESRRAAGPPPSADDVLAFFNGELTGDKAEHVRSLLISYPELARVALATFPAPGEIAADDGQLLSDSEIAGDWLSLRSRLHSDSGDAPPIGELRFWRSFAMAAAIAAVILGGLLVRLAFVEQSLTRQLREPRVSLEPLLLLPEGARGSLDAVTELPRLTDEFILQPAMINQPSYPDYRLSIIDVRTPPRTIWSGRGIRRRSDDTFEIRVPRALLDPGTYRLVIDGVAGSQTKRLASYPFHVPGK